jgi:type II secretory pathway predicted ATPase ExeA
MKPADQKQKKSPIEAVIPRGFLFFSKGQTAARKGLGEVLSSGVNFLAITGPSGSGKTTLLDQFRHHLTRNVTLAEISEHQNSSTDVLYDVLVAFGQTPDDIEHSELLKTLFNFLLEQYSQNNKPVLIIDNAETLDHDALMSFHSLSELRSEGNVLLRVILAGESDLVNHLNQAEFGPSAFLNPLIDIEPFTKEETYLYLNKYYHSTDAPKQASFSKHAAKLIHSYSHGNPLAINKLSKWAMKLANWKKKKSVTYYFANKALETAAWAGFAEQFPPVHVKSKAPANPPSAKQSPRIIVFKCNRKIAERSMGKKLVLLGRAPGSTITLRRPSVSRRHACLTIINNQVWIKNLSSTNKTYVNTNSVESHPLQDGDVIRVGDFLVLFLCEDTTTAEAVPRNLKSATKPSEKMEAKHTGSAETVMDIETYIDPKTQEVDIVTEDDTALEPHPKRKKRALSIIERRQRKKQAQMKRRFLIAAAGAGALLGPLLAVMLFFNQGNPDPTLEISAKMNTLESSDEAPPIIKGTELIEEELLETSADDSKIYESIEPPAPNDRLHNLVVEAREYLQRGELSQSLNLIMEGIRLDPENKDLLKLQQEAITQLAESEGKWNN